MSNAASDSETGSEASSFLTALKRFWCWWLDELSGMLPDWLSGQLKVQSRAILVSIDNGLCRIVVKNTQGTQQLTEFNSDAESSAEEIEQRRSLSTLSNDIILLLPPHFLLKKVISLPQAAVTKLDDVLKFEMDRNTPFKAEEVYFIHKIIERDKEQKKVSVELTIVTRSVLDELMDKLLKQGIKVSAVVPESSGMGEYSKPENNLISQHSGDGNRSQNRRRQHVQFWGLLIVLALLAGFGLFNRHQKVEQLSKAIEQPKQLANEAEKLRTELNRLEESYAFITARKITSYSPLTLLHELTILIPDNTWLTRFTIKDGQLLIQGESANSSTLISIIEQSDKFHNVRFSSPVTINPRTQKENFTITADLLSGGEE